MLDIQVETTTPNTTTTTTINYNATTPARKGHRANGSLEKTCQKEEERRRDHMHSHSGDKPYKCALCEYEARKKGNLIRHVKIVHRTTSVASVASVAASDATATSWKMEGAQEFIDRMDKTHIQKLVECLDKEHATDDIRDLRCGGQWLEAAVDLLKHNDITIAEWQQIMVACLN